MKRHVLNVVAIVALAMPPSLLAASSASVGSSPPSSTDGPVTNLIQDLGEVPDTVAEQVPVVKEESGRWLLNTTIKSGARIWYAPGLRPADGGGHMATDYSIHHSLRDAVSHSLRPQSLGSALQGSVKSSVHPLTLLGHVAAPVALEATAQLAETGRLDGGKLEESVQPLPIAGGFLGAGVGDAVGTTVQVGLGTVGGPAGRVAGMFVKPLCSWSGYYLGRNYGRTAADGKPTVKGAVADTLREINPVQFACSVAGATAGGVIGQALIPIPVVGYLAGYIAGGIVGTAIGNVLGKHGPTGLANKLMVTEMHRRANELDGLPPEIRREPVALAPDGSIVTRPNRTNPDYSVTLIGQATAIE